MSTLYQNRSLLSIKMPPSGGFFIGLAGGFEPIKKAHAGGMCLPFISVGDTLTQENLIDDRKFSQKSFQVPWSVIELFKRERMCACEKRNLRSLGRLYAILLRR